MPQFTYRAKKGPGEVVDGVIDAGTLEEAVEKLDRVGLLPIHMREVKEGEVVREEAKEKPQEPAPSPKVKRSGRVKTTDVTIFGRQLSSLIKSGVPILRALSIISEQSENGRFRDFLAHAQDEIKNGKSLSSILTQYPKLFPPIYLAMVRTGEDSGTLQETLLRVSDYRKRQEEILARVRSAMAYPALMALTGIGTVVFMLTYVIPRLKGLFSTMGGSLPVPTRILIAVSEALRQPWVWVVVGAVFLGAVILAKSRARLVGVLWSHLSLKTPLLKSFVLKAELARFTRTLELLIRSGISILKGLEIATPVVSNMLLREGLMQAREELTGGGSLGRSLRKHKHYPVFMANLITVGEESGNLEGALGEIASYYESETEETVKVMTSLIEPLLILVMGLLVGFIVISMLLPMFELNLMVK